MAPADLAATGAESTAKPFASATQFVYGSDVPDRQAHTLPRLPTHPHHAAARQQMSHRAAPPRDLENLQINAGFFSAVTGL